MMDRDPRPDIVVNHVNPGFVDTDMSSHKGTFTVDRWVVGDHESEENVTWIFQRSSVLCVCCPAAPQH